MKNVGARDFNRGPDVTLQPAPIPVDTIRADDTYV